MGSVGKLQEIYKKFGNLLPNEMQNKIAESYNKNLKNLDEMKQFTNQTDDYLKPHNDMEGQNDLLKRFWIRKRTILIISNGNA